MINYMTDVTASPEPATRIFLSYVRRDDEVFNFARPIKNKLERAVSGMSGKPADVFLDRDDIRAGDNWTDSIKNGVQSSFIFVPIYTANYSKSEACREEFFMFRSHSNSINVPGLIIPVALFGVDKLLGDGVDEISDYVRSHQCVDFGEAVTDGEDSPAFRRKVFEIASRAVDASNEAEASLVELELDGRQENVGRGSGPEVSGEVDDGGEAGDQQGGLVELIGEFESLAQLMTSDAEGLGGTLARFGDVAKEAPSPEGPKEAMQSIILLAERMKEPSQDLENTGVSLLDHAVRSDEVLRRSISVAQYSGSEHLIGMLRKSLIDSISSLDGIDHVDDQLEYLLEQMKAPEAMSSTLRQSLRPARRGITNVRDALRVIEKWKTLADALESD